MHIAFPPDFNAGIGTNIYVLLFRLISLSTQVVLYMYSLAGHRSVRAVTDLCIYDFVATLVFLRRIVCVKAMRCIAKNGLVMPGKTWTASQR